MAHPSCHSPRNTALYCWKVDFQLQVFYFNRGIFRKFIVNFMRDIKMPDDVAYFFFFFVLWFIGETFWSSNKWLIHADKWECRTWYISSYGEERCWSNLVFVFICNNLQQFFYFLHSFYLSAPSFSWFSILSLFWTWL